MTGPVNNASKEISATKNVSSANENTKQTPVRFLLHLSERASDIKHWSVAWDSPEELVSAALQAAKDAKLITSTATAVECTLLAKQHWGTRIFAVFDLANEAYDPAAGHLTEHNDLAVLTIYYKRHRIVAQLATEGMRSKVNEDVRYLHDMNGWGSTPVFEEDHRDGKYPNYYNARSLIHENAENDSSHQVD